MKKIITSLTILVVALMVMVGSVNATTVGVEPENTQKITAGQQVKLTVTADGRGEDFKVKYDTTKFALDETETRKVSPSITTINPNYDGQGQIMVISLANTNTVVFTAKEDMEVPAEDPAKAFNFDITEIHSVGVDTVPSLQATVTVTPATEITGGNEGEGSGSGTASEEGEGSNSETGNDSDEKYIDDNGNEITEITQAGNTYFVGVAIALVALVSGALAVKKIKK